MRRPTSVIITAVLLLLAVATPATAASPQPVDPATLTPPPNPNFDWNCVSNDQGITCRGDQTFGEIDFSFFECDGRPVLITFTQTETSHRFHDEAGRVIRTHVVGRFDETWRLEGSPTVLTSRGRWSETWHYPVPGDATTRSHQIHGATLMISAPGVGLVNHNAGLVRLDLDDSVLIALRGKHTFFETGEADVCEAFGI
jgi:hypothetical protein